MSKLDTALSALRAVVNGMPEESIDTHVRNLLNRCEEAIKALETAAEPTTSCAIMCNECGRIRKISQEKITLYDVNCYQVEIEDSCELCGKHSYCTGHFEGRMIENEE